MSTTLVSCPKCTYEGNAFNATHCEICKYPLKEFKQGNTFNKLPGPRKLIRRSSLVLTLFLLLTSGGIYLFWRTNSNSPSVVNSDQARSIAAKPNPASDLQIYNSMHDVPNVPKGIFNYGGALLFAPLRSPQVLKAIGEAQPQFHLRYLDPVDNKPGSRKGVSMLLNGQLSFSQNAQSLHDEEYLTAKERGFRLQEVPVAIDGVAFFTHPQLNIPGLSVNQLRDIYTGKITNWKQVGGPDLKIVPITLDPKDSSTMRLLTEGVGGIESVRAHIARDYTESIRQTSSSPGGISYGSASTVLGQKTIRPLAISKGSTNSYVEPFTGQGQINAQAFRDGSYALTRRIFVDIKRDGTQDEKAGVAYTNLLLSDEGQALVQRSGFVPLR